MMQVNSPRKQMPCSVVRDVIDLEGLRRRAQHPQAGAVIIFCGDVRNHSQQKKVSYLEYEARESMALKQISRIIEEAQQKWKQLSCPQCTYKFFWKKELFWEQNSIFYF